MKEERSSGQSSGALLLFLSILLTRLAPRFFYSRSISFSKTIQKVFPHLFVFVAEHLADTPSQPSSREKSSVVDYECFHPTYYHLFNFILLHSSPPSTCSRNVRSVVESVSDASDNKPISIDTSKSMRCVPRRRAVVLLATTTVKLPHL